MNINNAQSETQPSWASQNRKVVCSPHSSSEAGFGGVGRESRDIGGGVDRTSGTQAVLTIQITSSVVGKILTRLVDRAEQRLNEAEECLVWYERQKQQASDELADLRAMIEELNKTEE